MTDKENSIYTTDRVLDALNKTITKDNIDTTKDIILIINEKLKTDIKILYDNSKLCKLCNRYFVKEGKKHSWCPPCKLDYMSTYKKKNGNISKKSKRGLDYTKEAHCKNVYLKNQLKAERKGTQN
jgi:predicted Zn-ribbon and HTH transcriptional regulator